MTANKDEQIILNLHDGTVLIYNPIDRVIFQASRPGAIPITVDPESIVDDLILTLAKILEKGEDEE